MKKRILTSILLLILTALLLCMLIPPVTASADGSYDIDSVEFFIELTPEGNAKIHEKWRLSFNGTFHRFRHGIFTDLPKFQEFGDIEVEGFKINGESVPYNQSGENLTGDLLTDKNEKQLCWYKNVSGKEKNIYEADYVLTDIVKRKDDEIIFSPRLIGQKFTDTIWNLDVYIKKVPGLYAYDPESEQESTAEYYHIGKTCNSGYYAPIFCFRENDKDPYFTKKLTSVSESDLEKKTNFLGQFRLAWETFKEYAAVAIPLGLFGLIFVLGLFSSGKGGRGGFSRGCGGGSRGGSSGCGGCGGGGCGGGGCGGGGCGGGGCGGGGAD